ncbi:hypothetical protein LCGC14_0660160 [marine sediment metagenome]|uniref:Uncharacterized protein n=1 Tax=marine sediment metagenome TaxID=412755 RepID=A0A0F9U208_9ZZZZ
MLKIGKFELCKHVPICVCEGLGGYMRITEVERKPLGYRIVETDIGIWITNIVKTRQIFYEDVFSYSWLRAVRM